MHRFRRPVGRALLLAVALAVLSACVADTGADPEACAAPSVSVRLALTAESLDPNDPAVCRGQEVTLTVASEVDGVFHVHGYDAEVPATSVEAGQETTIEFSAARSGQFPIELHAADSPDGVELGVLTVHEP